MNDRQLEKKIKRIQILKKKNAVFWNKSVQQVSNPN
jgi:hypothetical protein